MVGALFACTAIWVLCREPLSSIFRFPYSFSKQVGEVCGDFVIGNSYRNGFAQEGPDDDLSSLATWSSEHGHAINKTKFAECL